MNRSPLLTALATAGLLALSACAGTPKAPPLNAHASAHPSPFAFEDSEILPIGTSHTYGPADAPIVIVEFISLQCPYCARGAATLMEFQQRHPDDIQVVFKHLPLSFQAQSRPAARVAEAAGRQGKFFEMTTLILQQMTRLNQEGALELGRSLAEDLGLDMAQFETDLHDPSLDKQIDQDIALAESLGVQGTPNFFVNGLHLPGARPIQDFEAFYQVAMDFHASLQESDLPPEESYRTAVEALRQFQLDAEAEHQAQQEAILETGDLVTVPVHDTDLTYGATDDFLITIVEFSSLQCPFCARASETMRQLQAAYPDQIRFVFKHFPLPSHAHSVPAGRAVFAAHQQNKGAEMLHLVFDRQSDLPTLSEADFQPLATELGLDLDQFSSDYFSAPALDVIRENQTLGSDLGIRGTPVFIVNGEVVIGAFPYLHFREIIEAELPRAQKLRESTGLQDHALYEAITEDKTR